VKLSRRIAAHTASAVFGALVGALLVLAADGLTRTLPIFPSEPGVPRPRPVSGAPPNTLDADKVLLAWAPGGVPAGADRVLERLPGVAAATSVIGGLDWLEASRAPDGSLLDAPPKGFAVPVEVAIVKPRDYARFVPRAERAFVLGLGRGEALVAKTESELRGAGEGMRLRLTDRTLETAAVVSDATTNGYEVLMRGPVPKSWRRADRFVLVHLRRSDRRGALTRRIRSLLAPGQVLRVRSQSETTWLRYADAVHPQMLVKRSFGEFAARPRPDGTIVPDPRWVRRNILRARVPVLGEVSCHRALFPQLRGALREIEDAGLAYALAQYGGCYNPRFINREPGGRLSHHAWGVAIDINVADNAYGTRPDQDQRLVQIMEEWGFTWGGRWLVPDGMHFEWSDWP
jgi:hypothetical protein